MFADNLAVCRDVDIWEVPCYGRGYGKGEQTDSVTN